MISKVLKRPVKRRVMKKLVNRFMRYIRKPSNELGLFVLTLHKKWYNFPADIFLDDGDIWTNLGNKKIMPFAPCGDDDCSPERVIPMTIENKPEILVKNATIKLIVSDIGIINSFVRKYKTQIIQLGNYKSDRLKFFEMLEKDDIRKDRKDA
jgi:hypothetical protein